MVYTSSQCLEGRSRWLTEFKGNLNYSEPCYLNLKNKTPPPKKKKNGLPKNNNRKTKNLEQLALFLQEIRVWLEFVLGVILV